MAETSRFWNGTTVGDATIAPYDASTEFSQVLMAVSGASQLANKGGVWRDDLAGLNASIPAANTLRVSAGRAQVYGTWYENDADLDVTVPTASVVTRYDTIVLRKDWTAQTARIVRHAGVEGSLWPTLTQSSGSTWEVPLWDVKITAGGTLTIERDRREFINDTPSGEQVNLLTNPGFEIWQRGAGPFTANNNYTADRWIIFLGAISTISVAPETGTVDGGSYRSLKITYNQFANSAIRQKLEDYYQLRGNMVTFSARVKADTASVLRLSIEENGGAAGNVYTNSSWHTGDDTWQTLSVSRYLATDTTYVSVQISLEGNVIAYVDNAVLVIGPTVRSYKPLHPAEDLTRCQRYYEVHGGTTTFPAPVGYASGVGERWDFVIPFNTQKYASPSLTKNGTWDVTNVGQPTVDATGGKGGYRISISSNGAGLIAASPNGADDTITAETNP